MKKHKKKSLCVVVVEEGTIIYFRRKKKKIKCVKGNFGEELIMNIPFKEDGYGFR